MGGQNLMDNDFTVIVKVEDIQISWRTDGHMKTYKM